MAGSGALPQATIALHACATLVYFGLGLTIVPRPLQRITQARGNVLAQNSPVAYVVVVPLAYTAIASAFDISLVFAVFLAGFAIVSDTEHLGDAVATLAKVSFAVFIPVYFAVVGYKLDRRRSLSLEMLPVFLAVRCAVKLLFAGVGARLAGFPAHDAVNLAVALNVRGGPGIVLASVAPDARIVNATFYTALVLVAILTSQGPARAWHTCCAEVGPLLSAKLEGQLAPAGAAERSLAGCLRQEAEFCFPFRHLQKGHR